MLITHYHNMMEDTKEKLEKLENKLPNTNATQ